MEDLTSAWERFTKVLKCYGDAFASLNEPCPSGRIRQAERELGFELPEPLVRLLELSDGQKPDTDGVFKSVSGWNRYRRHVFLDVESVVAVYRHYAEDEDLVKEYPDEVPFASESRSSCWGEVFAIHRETLKVSLIWTTAGDPFLPPEWQFSRFGRGEDLAEFLRFQGMLYR
jgi:cell wall assembly regulator SMI1